MRKTIASALLSSMVLFAGAGVAGGAPPERWVEARSTHFAVLTDAGEKQAQRVASQFERMYMVFHTLLPASEDDGGAPIVVVAVRDRKGMQQLEPAEYLGKDRIDLSGFFLRAPDKNYILLRLDAEEAHAYANVYHEYTHYLMRKADGWLPLWLNEGLAQFYENTDIDDKTVWLGQANPDELRFLRAEQPAADSGAAEGGPEVAVLPRRAEGVRVLRGVVGADALSNCERPYPGDAPDA